MKKAWNIRNMYDRKIIYIEKEKNRIVMKKELILEKTVRSAENVNLPKEESDLQQIIKD